MQGSLHLILQYLDMYPCERTIWIHGWIQKIRLLQVNLGFLDVILQGIKKMEICEIER